MSTRALVLCDDQWHPGEIVRRGFAALKHHAFNFEFLDEGGKWSRNLMMSYPIVVVAKANHINAANQQPWLTPQTQMAFREYVRAGGGLLAVHAGTCYRDLPEMRGVVGGAFLRHPEQCPVVFEPKAGHPLTNGVEIFVEEDEHYFMALDANDADVFLHSRSAHGIQPAGWTRAEGSGRVCVLTPGHNAAVWRNLEFQKLLANALCWTARLN